MKLDTKPKDYEEVAGFRITPSHSSPEFHARVIESYVNVCVDATPVDFSHQILWLARRRIKPRQDWWWIGGAMRAGESAEEAIARKWASETSVEIAPERFRFVCLNRYFWRDRRQAPQDRGCDCLVYTFLVELDEVELKVASAGLDPIEYDPASGLQEFDRSRLVAIKAHPALLDFYDRVFS